MKHTEKIVFMSALSQSTPPNMRAYSIFLINTALIDMVTAFTGILSCTRALNAADNTTVMVFLGPCSLISKHLCNLCHTVAMSLANQSTLLVVLSFSYRLYILEESKAGRHKRAHRAIVAICIASTVFSAFNSVIKLRSLKQFRNITVHFRQRFERSIPGSLERAKYRQFYFDFTPKARKWDRNYSYYFQCRCIALTHFSYLLFAKKAHAKNTENCSIRTRSSRSYCKDANLSIAPASWVFAFGHVLVARQILADYVRITAENDDNGRQKVMSINCLASPIINVLYLPSYRRFLVTPEILSTSTPKVP
ncbi:hypothetical protein PRIPAC_78061 [Pristionchus pacificus]|uniref:G protein-coupled receptor n=1 Tax=Pristionchus pacificus TaxID=54126 RepID=A0A2A6CL29_PRIPA|nr:hypothetical protein PRIPAC_78061 [Pristionchus pacificus]|eukprot:PDM78798.1 G protein-coupled receptor [Pristionchus pacificus]